MDKPIDYVVICASGKGTRLEPLTKYIPKYLVNPSNFNLLTIIVNYWKSYTNNLILIIEEKYNEITKYYMDLLNVNYKILNVNITDQGNGYTLYHALGETYNNFRILITWCDIFPTENIPHYVFNKDAIIFTYGNGECRYNYCDNILSPQSNGNVIGIYYFKKFVSMTYINNRDDIIDAIPRYYPILDSYELTNLSDVGDMPKLLNYNNITKTKYSTRYYNKITEIGPNKLKKEVAHPVGIEIIKGEINFYREIQKYSLPCFPTIYELGDTHFVMEHINGHMLKDLPIDDYLEKLIITLKTLHQVSMNTVSKSKLIEDLNFEFNSKIKMHVEKIKPLLSPFSYITRVNDLDIQQYNMNKIIDDLYLRIEKKLAEDNCIYNLIHADSHFSNTMVSSDSKQIVFIDPYGRFGHSMIHGNVYFDFCLILFSLTGFDSFSSSKDYHFDISGTTLNTNISIKDFELCKTLFKSYNINWDICLYMCILHWAKFTFYTSNHILKSVASYYHAIYLYHRFINI
jgi:hypothetical protein